MLKFDMYKIHDANSYRNQKNRLQTNGTMLQVIQEQRAHCEDMIV